VEARTALAFALITDGQADQAASEFQEIFKQTVAGIEGPYKEGLGHLAARRTERAEASFRDAFFAEPYRLTKLYKAALTQLRTERWQEAAESLREAMALNPSYADLPNYLGVALAESGDREGAIASFRESIRLNPRYSIARLNLAYALSGPDEIREAEEILETLLQEDPGNSPARARMEEIRSSRVDPRRLEVRRAVRGRERA
jgi:tetratricopeptide (TPR) repeat protein